MSKNLSGLSERKDLKKNLLGAIVKAGLSPADSRDTLLKELSQEYLFGKSSILGTSSFSLIQDLCWDMPVLYPYQLIFR
jgi:hypothetical protein